MGLPFILGAGAAGAIIGIFINDEKKSLGQRGMVPWSGLPPFPRPPYFPEPPPRVPFIQDLGPIPPEPPPPWEQSPKTLMRTRSIPGGIRFDWSGLTRFQAGPFGTYQPIPAARISGHRSIFG